MKKKEDTEINRDIEKRFKQEEKYVVDPVKEPHEKHFFSIFMSIVMVSVVFISIFYTFLSLWGGR